MNVETYERESTADKNSEVRLRKMREVKLKD